MIAEDHGPGGMDARGPGPLGAQVASQGRALDILSGRLGALEERTRVVGEQVAGIQATMDAILARLDKVHTAPCVFLQRHVEAAERRAFGLWSRDSSRLWSLLTIFLSAVLGGMVTVIVTKVV